MFNKMNHKFIEVLIVIFAFLGSITFYYSNPDQFVSDDSLFYVVIAQHFLETGLSTFNGYIETNGYHPLWQVCNIVAVWFSNTLSVDPLIIVGFMYHAFMAGALYLLYKINKLMPFFSFSISSLLLIFLFIANGTLHNMESALALFFVLYSLYYVSKTETVHNLDFFIVGLLLGLTFLSRLDLVFFGMIVALYIFYKYRNTLSKEPKSLIYFIVGGLLLVVPYFTYNYLTFGSIAPVSGALKSSFPVVTFSWNNLMPYGLVSIVFAVLAFVFAVRNKDKKIKLVLFILSISTIIHAVYLALFQFPMSWYFITGYLTMVLMIGYLIQKIHITILTYFVLLVVWLGIFATSYMKTISNYTLTSHLLHHGHMVYSKESRKKIMGDALKKILPPKSTVFAWDLPGALGYYSQWEVFSADGLITNKEYQIELAKEGARGVFEKYDIEYIAIQLTEGKWLWYDGMLFEPLANGSYRLTFYSRLLHKKAGTLILHHKDIVGTVPATHNESSTIGVFKIPKDAQWMESTEK